MVDTPRGHLLNMASKANTILPPSSSDTTPTGKKGKMADTKKTPTTKKASTKKPTEKAPTKKAPAKHGSIVEEQD